MVSLSVSCVSFSGNYEVLVTTINSLQESGTYAKQFGSLKKINLHLIDNGPDQENLNTLERIKKEKTQYFDAIKIFSGHGNLGYGAGNNLSIFNSNCDYHLVLNPDVIMAVDAIQLAIAYLNLNSGVGLVAPDAHDPSGSRQFLAKRTPDPLVLAARALNLKWLNRVLKKRLYRYECRDLIPSINPIPIDYASGCFMFCRLASLKQLGGFDPGYFMYFEDNDLSRRMKKIAEIHYVPYVKIIHAGGGVARKGGRHILYFLRSMLRFFSPQ